MNKCLLLGFTLLLVCTVAEGLVCKVCKYKIGTLCLKTDDPCQASQGQFCESTKVYAGEILLFKRYGCSKYAELCNKTERRENALKMAYERTCCDTDLCNG
ncbi:lymphocyte antigen 6 complex locus protein G6c-like [Rhineura floridana]|uniref:lymphocyte antigen 6 complex locus protein G6c-like n=1 Tax=Rhineura floridana TaxID=261503 RepID=UPI002AC85F06|nr:lymphocyte antigen 6 complex locus protein G6c-like [Rhineura floridana]